VLRKINHKSPIPLNHRIVESLESVHFEILHHVQSLLLESYNVTLGTLGLLGDVTGSTW